jgi:hypothetical protein
MARIPVYQERQAVGQLVAVPQLSAPNTGAGAIGQAMGQVGTALNRMANTEANILERQAKTWATQTSTEELLHWTERTEQLKATMPAGGAGYVETLNKEMNDRWNKILANAPDNFSRNFLSQNFLTLRKTLISDGLQFQVVEGRADELNKLSQKSDAISLVSAKTKNPVLMQEQLGQLDAEVDSSTLLPKQKAEIKLKSRQNASIALASSVVRDSPQIAIDILSKTATKLTGNYDKEKLFLAQQTVESANNPKAVSEKNAVGLMQVQVPTAIKPGYNLPNIFDFAISKGKDVTIRDEIAAAELLKDEKIGQQYGRMYMDAMLKEFDGNVVHALAAYNWGPGATNDWIAKGADLNALPKETRDYIPKVLNAAGITGADAGQPKDSVFAMLPLGEQLKLLNQAKENESVQFSESIAGATWNQFGPKTDTDPIELDVLNAHVDVAMASRTVEERKNAKSLIKQYASDFQASSNQRQAERVSGIWTNVMNGSPMTEIQGSPEWKNLNGTEQKKLITEINTFRTRPTQPAQWAMYADISGNKPKLANMPIEQILAMAPQLGNELTTKLVQEKAKLNSPEDISKAEYDEDSFKIFASKAGLKIFESKASAVEKEKIGQFRFAVENAMVIRSNELRRPLSRAEQDDVMTEVLSNKVYVDEIGKDPEVIMALVSKDDMGDTYVVVGSKQIYLKEIPASSRGMIIRQLRSAGMPVTEAAIAEVYLAAQQQRDPQFEQIPQ